jgi:AP2 domain
MSRSSRTPGICRIDQPSHRTHGFFVRLQRHGKIYSAFFTDRKYGGRAAALAAAQDFHRQATAIFGPPLTLDRRRWAELPRRKGRSGIVGVQRMIDRQSRPWRKYWVATWSPELGVVRKKQFSIRKFGEERAKQLAIRARRAGVRSMT